MAQLYRSRVQSLYDALQVEDERKRSEAADIIRTLVEDIVLTPVDAFGANERAEGGAGSSQVKMVAGARNYRFQQSLIVRV